MKCLYCQHDRITLSNRCALCGRDQTLLRVKRDTLPLRNKLAKAIRILRYRGYENGAIKQYLSE